MPSVCACSMRVCVYQPTASQVCFPHCLTLVWGMFRVQSRWPWSGCTEQLDDRPERPMTQTAGPYRPAGTGQPCVLCVSVCGHGSVFSNASSCCLHTNFLSPTDTPVQKYKVPVGAGNWHINTFFHSLPESAHHSRLRNICLQRVFKQPQC